MLDLFNGFINSKSILAFLLGGGIALILGPIIIPILHKLKFGQNIRKEGLQSHLKKAGTPTIGGLIFIIAIVIVMIALRYEIKDEAMIVLFMMLAFAVIGFLDDLLKIIHKENEGLTSKQKFILQIIFSLVIAYYGYSVIGSEVAIPFTNIFIDFKILYIPFIVIYLAAVTNAVNLTDGLDGLATTVTIIVLAFLSIMSFNLGHESLSVFSIGLIGALLGFLKYNAYKARVFMGDTGSLALGGAVAGILLVLKSPFLVILIGGIYFVEACSVIIQVTSFKLTGKRVFKMAPIHHHFEILGWSEVKIVTVFSIITCIVCMVGFFAF